MGLGFTTAFLINTMKSIKTLTQYGRENENWKGKKLTVHKEYEHSNTEGLILRQCICKRKLQYESSEWELYGERGSCWKQSKRKTNTLCQIQPSIEPLSHQELWASLPNNNPCSLTYKSDNFLILGCFSGENRAIPFPIVCEKTQFETQLVSCATPCFLLTQFYLIFQTGNLLLLQLHSVSLSN